MAVKIAHDLGLFSILTNSETAVSCEVLAAQSGACLLLVGSLPLPYYYPVLSTSNFIKYYISV